MTSSQAFTARMSLSFLWIFTAITSTFFSKDIGYEILARGKIVGDFADICIVLGSFINAFLGVWVFLNRRLKLCFLIQIVIIVSYSILLTLVDANFWLHPFGPLTKNIPILVLIYILYVDDTSQSKSRIHSNC